MAGLMMRVMRHKAFNQNDRPQGMPLLAQDLQACRPNARQFGASQGLPVVVVDHEVVLCKNFRCLRLKVVPGGSLFRGIQGRIL